MKIDKVPLLGALNKNLNKMMINLILLAAIFMILAILILVFPKALDVLAAALLFVTAFIFLNLAYDVTQFKKKYMKYFKD